MNAIKVDLDACTGCASPYTAGWIDVIRFDGARKRPVMACPEDCVECNYGAISSPSESIRVNPDDSKPWPPVCA